MNATVPATIAPEAYVGGEALLGFNRLFSAIHTETDKIPITEPEHVGYRFQRLSALIRLLLNAGGALKWRLKLAQA